MNRREELVRKVRQDPAAFVQERIELEDQLQQQICAQLQTLAEETQTIAGQIEPIDEQKALIGQLQRLLFGPSSEKLPAEQEAQLAEVANDLQAQRPAPDGEEVLAAEEPDQKKKRRRGGRHPMPVHLEVQTTVLEPANANCEHCGTLGAEIGREVSEEINLIPARLIVRRTVRIQRRCQCGCGKIAIAPLPAQLIPGSKPGVGLAVFSVWPERRLSRMGLGVWGDRLARIF